MPTLLASSTSSKLSVGDDLLGIVRGPPCDVRVGVKRIPWMAQRSAPLANLKLNTLARHNNIKEPTSTARESSPAVVAVGEEVAGISGGRVGTHMKPARSGSDRGTVLVDKELRVDNEDCGVDNQVPSVPTSCTSFNEDGKEMKFFASCSVKEEYRVGGSAGVGTLEDDSLTSLHWLTGVRVHDCDGKPLQLQYTPPSPAPSGSSSDEGDGTADPSPGKSKVTGALKPPYSYATLIIMAMKENTAGKMTLSEIYRWIAEKFVYYQNSPPTWHNSIRHNLSLNKCFKKIPRKKGEPGKGGYWALVPEFADKLLETNIRKRRSSAVHCGDKSGAKRQRLQGYTDLEQELMSKFKTEPTDVTGSENTLAHCKFDTSYPNTPDTTVAPDTPDSLNSPDSLDHWDQPDCPDMINDTCGIELLSELQHCRRDHAYGKSPVVNYDDSDEEKIREIAMNLQGTSSIIDTALIDTCDKTTISNSKLSTTLSSAIRSGCIWRYDENLSPHDISNDTMELLEAQQYTPFEDFCLSPPMSGDDEGYSDDVDDGCYNERRHLDDGLLTVQGTAMTIFEPGEGIRDDFLKEELSPTC